LSSSVTSINDEVEAVNLNESSGFRGKRWVKAKSVVIRYAFVVPALIFYFAFLIYPAYRTVRLSTTNWDGIAKTYKHVGLKNYQRLFDNDIVHLAFKNTLIWSIAIIVIPTLIGLTLAVALNEEFRGRTFLRTIFYSPGVLPLIGVALIWGWIYNPDSGFLNQFLDKVGLEQFAQPWLGQPSTALWAVIVAGIWVRTGFPMLLYLSALQTIPKEHYEAARLDGASGWRLFRDITLPSLSQTHVVVIALAVIDALKVFDLVYGMTYGGPGNATQVVGTWAYMNLFNFNKTGYGSAIAVVGASISLIIGIPYVIYQARK
jgi:raffinose/stachyose/melibiose transport system permease protein